MGLIKRLLGMEKEPKFVEVRVKTRKNGENYFHPLTIVGEHPLAGKYRQRLQEHNIQHMQINGLNEHESYVLLR